MKKLFKIKTRTLVLFYILADLICLGAGMGVPVFCILLGFPLGWYLAKRNALSKVHSKSIYYKILKASLLATAFTFIILAILWSNAVLMIFHPIEDIKNFGHPFILFEPRASLIGWVMLMIFVSPFLQLLASIFASFLTLMKIESKNRLTRPD